MSDQEEAKIQPSESIDDQVEPDPVETEPESVETEQESEDTEPVKLCLGIDLGTTNSVICYYNPESDLVEVIPNDQGDRLTPSCVNFGNGQEISVGIPAQEGEDGICLSHVKRFIGKKFEDGREAIEMLDYQVVQDHNGYPTIPVEFEKGGETITKKYKPEEISAQVLYYLKRCAEEYLGTKVTEAVITVPAYFNESQRRATKDAATIAGLKCLRLVAEPTAACLCYGLHKSDAETVLVYDLGGGTLDCSILELNNGIFEVIATSGNTQLGGADVDFVLREFIEMKYKEKNGLAEDEPMPEDVQFTQLMAEAVKKTLSHTKQTTVRLPNFKYVLTRATLEMLMHDFIETCMEPVDQVLKDANMGPDDISQIVLVGGSTRIPLLQKTLKQMFGNKPLNKSINPDEAVAYGAAIQASIQQNIGSASKGLVLLDVTPLSLGIETKGATMAPIIPRNTTLPCEASKIFSTVEDNQETVEIKVFQGERQFTRDNFGLGIFLLEGLPLTPRGVPKIKVTFRLDCDGLLQVTAVDKNTGLANSITLKSDTNLNDQEISQLIKEAEVYRARDSLRKQSLEALDGFRQYMYGVQRQINLEEMEEVLGDERSGINQYILEILNWIDETQANTEDELNLEDIQSNRETAEYNLKPYLNKMYSHQEELIRAGIRVDPIEENLSANKAGGNGSLEAIMEDICEDLMPVKK